MGAWSTSINGNDTAEDLKDEYTVAFWRYDVDTAVAKIEEYVRSEGIDERDSIVWCDYVYSLADYMWRKGILTDEIKQRALTMIEAGFGLEDWAQSGEKVLKERKKVLAAFREKLLSPMPPKKKIKPNVHTDTIFTNGDIIAVQLQTAGKPYTASDQKPMTDEAFHALDGKYVIVQKINDFSSWQSALDPDVRDYWAVFRLFDGVFDSVPAQEDILSLKDAQIVTRNRLTPLFYCESSMFYFKKRNYVLLGNDAKTAKQYCDHESESIFFGINNPWQNPDSELLCAMGKEITCQAYDGSLRELESIIYSAINYESKYDPYLSREENDALILRKKETALAQLEQLRSDGGCLYTVRFGVPVGVASFYKGKVEHLFIYGPYRSCGFDTALLKYITECAEKS